MKSIIMIAILTLILGGCTKRIDSPDLSGEYLGQKLPGDEPELFAPGIISNGMRNRDIAITPDGNEIYTVVMVGGFTYSKIVCYKQFEDRWTGPELVSFSSELDYIESEPCISPDGKKFYFITNRTDSVNGKTDDNMDIWVADRIGENWSEAYNVGLPISSPTNEYFPSITNEGTMYFCRREADSRDEYVYRSQFIDGKFQEPERLPDNVNIGQARFNTFISANEDFIIVPSFGMPDSFGSTDYYIVFRNENDEWSEPVNMGSKVNTEAGLEYSPYVTRDGKYFFFMSQRLGDTRQYSPLTYDKLMKLTKEPENGNSDIYWMKADFIYELKPEGFSFFN